MVALQFERFGKELFFVEKQPLHILKTNHFDDEAQFCVCLQGCQDKIPKDQTTAFQRIAAAA